MNLFRESEFSYLSDIEKEFKECKKSEIKYYLDNLEELEYLMFYQRNNIDTDSRDYYELLKDGRKYLYEKKV